MKKSLGYLTFLLMFVVASLEQGVAMNVVPPDELKFTSADGKITFFYKVSGTPTVVNKDQPSKKMLWTGVSPEFPSVAVISPEANFMYFLGGYGDAGSDLGLIVTRDLTSGRLVSETDLKTLLPQLEKVSGDNSSFGNFPWIDSKELTDHGAALIINVCKKWKVKVHGKTGQAQVISEIKTK